MTVRSEELRPKRHSMTIEDMVLLGGKIGVWCAVASFGGVFWAANGGFSVLGMEVMAENLNQAGALFWAAMSAMQFPVPVSVPGLPATQPLLPWVGVVGASLLQISTLYLTLRGRTPPPVMIVAAVALSAYDLVSTFFGLGTNIWVQQSGPIVQGVIALILTFIVEITLSLLLGGKEAVWNRLPGHGSRKPSGLA